MQATQNETEFLFTYGTLQYEKVQMKHFKRLLQGKADALVGYTLGQLTIKDEEVIRESGEKFHPIISYSGNASDLIPGMVYAVTKADLKEADIYEGEDYKRIKVKLASGIAAWVYVDVDSK